MSQLTHSTTQAIRDAFESWGQAWNNGDLNGYLAGYWDSDQTRYVSNAEVIEGRSAIVEAYQARFTSPEMMGTLNLTRLEIELIGEDNALIFGMWQLQRGTGTATGVFTAHVRRFDGVWLMVSDHTSG